MSINRKIALGAPTAAWCDGEYVGLRRKVCRFDTTVGFDFMHSHMSIWGWDGVVVIE